MRTDWYVTKPKGIVYSLDIKRLVFKKLRCWLSSWYVHCSCRGPEFHSQQPYLMVHFCLEFQFQEIWHFLLTLDDTCIQICILFPQINNLRIKNVFRKRFLLKVKYLTLPVRHTICTLSNLHFKLQESAVLSKMMSSIPGS